MLRFSFNSASTTSLRLVHSCANRFLLPALLLTSFHYHNSSASATSRANRCISSTRTATSFSPPRCSRIQLVQHFSEILSHHATQESMQIEKTVANSIDDDVQPQQRVSQPAVSGIPPDSGNYDPTILTAKLRLRKDCWISAPAHQRSNGTAKKSPASSYHHIFPTHYSDAHTGLIGTPSSEYVLDSVLLLATHGGKKGLAEEFASNTSNSGKLEGSGEGDDEEGNEEENDKRRENMEYALSIPNMYQGTRRRAPATPPTLGQCTNNNVNFTIFLNDVESRSLEPNFVAAIKDSVEFASSWIEHSNYHCRQLEAPTEGKANNLTRVDKVTVVALAQRDILIDLVQSNELENCESKWKFSENVTLILVPTFSYYSLVYLTKKFAEQQKNQANNFAIVVQGNVQAKVRSGLNNAFVKRPIVLQPWMRMPLFMLRDLTQNSRSVDEDPKAVTPQDTYSMIQQFQSTKGSHSPASRLIKNETHLLYATKISRRFQEETLTRLQNKLASVSRRWMISKLSESFEECCGCSWLRSDARDETAVAQVAALTPSVEPKAQVGAPPTFIVNDAMIASKLGFTSLQELDDFIRLPESFWSSLKPDQKKLFVARQKLLVKAKNGDYRAYSFSQLFSVPMKMLKESYSPQQQEVLAKKLRDCFKFQARKRRMDRESDDQA